MKSYLPDADTVRAAMDTVLSEATATGRRATVSAVERRLGITHATFYRHYPDLITEYFQSRLSITAAKEPSSHRNEQDQDNLRRLRRENADLRATLHLYEEAIRQLSLDIDALRQSGTVSPMRFR
ncbi:hypothetical protein AB0J03_32755 [Streptomyces microflavus]|uniref:hypothetical protein n=1 Tax=Streptomyces microflavus TaxID=1919 RepID=UPI003404245D